MSTASTDGMDSVSLSGKVGKEKVNVYLYSASS